MVYRDRSIQRWDTTDLGQRQPGLGALTLYEFNFAVLRGGSYEPALSYPIA